MALLELFGMFEVSEFSNIPTPPNELEKFEELSSRFELVGEGDSSSDTIGFTSAIGIQNQN